ncbi:Exportin-5 [Drechslerella dactyloides]|uniref:Exportin-5 n=1 Tax=Drechslerella dactyloides TaxID=74499 RepID=A0AAD6NGN3_DREDA|nr:Exportin-5 [Drechslerella dactyloides]
MARIQPSRPLLLALIVVDMDAAGDPVQHHHLHLANGGSSSTTTRDVSSTLPQASPSTLADGSSANAADGPAVQQIIAALQVIHDPSSSNSHRKHAGDYLEHAKADAKAPLHGFTLAADLDQIPAVRHFGLGLLAHAIRYNWLDYAREESDAIRLWVVQLAQRSRPDDPSYLRNKVAQLWVDVAKRSWAAEWLDMDFNLVKLWETDLLHRELAMYILESLVDEIFNREDSHSDPRTSVLHKACVDIFTPFRVLAESYPQRENKVDIRCGQDGWLGRLVLQLQECLAAGVADPKAEAFAVQALSTLRACMSWSIPKAIVHTGAVDCLGRAMMCGNAQLRVLTGQISIEALTTLFQREFLDDDDFRAIVGPLYRTATIRELRNILAAISVDAEAPDEDIYLFLKRFAEMIGNLGNTLEEKYSCMPPDADVSEFLLLLFEFAKAQSLVVSQHNISAWARILRKEDLRDHPTAQQLAPQLIQFCDERLLRYESLPANSKNPSYLFLFEDFETMPERHSFLGNYRRYLSSIIDSLVRRRPFEVFPFILNNLDSAITQMLKDMPPITPENYVKNSDFYLRTDAKFTVVDAALKGYIRWFTSLSQDSIRESQEPQSAFENNLGQWCEKLLTIDFQDPMIKKKVVQLVVALSTTALENQPGLMLKALEYVLLTRLPENTPNGAYNDAVKDLQGTCIGELQRLAVKMPDNLISVYGQLEMKINEIMTTQQLDGRHRLAYQTFLYSIVLHTKQIDPQLRIRTLESHLTPIIEDWCRPELTEMLSSFDGFCRLLMLNQVEEYLHTRKANQIRDWSAHELDAEGQTLQSHLTDKYNALPLRATKGYIAITADKIKKPSPTYDIACHIWRNKINLILPNLLKFLTHAHAFHNPKNWGNLPLELHPVMQRVLTDRFWQSGISSGSRDEFYENVSKTRLTMEGFASSIRGTIRTVRETCYSILWALGKLDINFYDYPELPGPLTIAMFQDADSLSSHQMTTLINISRVILDECPVQYRPHFLTPFLSSLFLQVDKKVVGEWTRLVNAGLIATTEEDKLTVEMKEESVLRQLTYTAVLVVAQLLDPGRPETGFPTEQLELSQSEPSAATKREGQMREFILSCDNILEPLILFCTHVLGMRDSRCCGIIIRVFRSILDEFVTRPGLREFICREVFMAAINSFNNDYFVEIQKDLAGLIAQIYTLYSPSTDQPRQLLLTVPGVTEQKVNTFHRRVMGVLNARVQRSLMMDLLGDVRGVPLSEKGKVVVPRAKEKEKAEKEKERERKAAIEREQREAMDKRTPEYGGLADMFS